MISLRDVSFAYPDGHFSLEVERLEVPAGGRLALVGPSGSGKSTLLNIIAGNLLPRRGTVAIDGESMQDKDEASRRRFRLRNIGLVFQDFALLPYLKVRDNIRLPMLADPSLKQKDLTRRCDELLESVGLGGFGARWPYLLSQGQRQRVAICRALITRPKLIIADEPTGSLDPANTAQVMRTILDAAAAWSATFLMSTHQRTLRDSFDAVLDMSAFHGESST